MFKLGIAAMFGAVMLYVAAICTVIYFIFWCLREFGILAALGI